MKKLIQLCLLLLFTVTTAFAQVEYQIEWIESTETYQVSLKSNTTWEAPYNITSTAQITIKVPTGDFEVDNFVNMIHNVSFEQNSRHNAPEESPEFDYISFGLNNIGTDKINYTEGEIIPLFSFKNSGTCNGEIYLIGENDAFMPPNQAMANVGNSITTLGGGPDNAWIGNVGDGKADCSFVNSVDEQQLLSSFNIFPNPVDDNLNLKFTWTESNEIMTITLFDINGKEVMNSKQTFTHGKNAIVLDVQELRAGTYTLEIKGDDLKLVVDRFVKL